MCDSIDQIGISVSADMEAIDRNIGNSMFDEYGFEDRLFSLPFVFGIEPGHLGNPSKLQGC